ncbi:MAG: DNA primase [Pseudomonadota bacterium]
MAGRIPQSTIEEILQRTDIVDLVRQFVPLKRAGKNWAACCPFHDEHSPSFTVSPDKSFFYCFGCGAKGNAIGFLMDYQHLSFPEAVGRLAEQANITLELEAESSNAQEYRDQKKSSRELLEIANTFFRQQLTSAPHNHPAKEYLISRGVRIESQRNFEIGYAPNQWDGLLQQLKKQKIHEAQLKESGLFADHAQGRMYDRFRHRIMFPIRNHRGELIGFGGRAIGDSKPKYLNSPETTLFQKIHELYGIDHALKQSRNHPWMMIVEGYLDVIALHEHGIHDVVATLGTSTSQEHIRQLFRYTDQLIFCFDGDSAGHKAAWRATEILLRELPEGKTCRLIFLPDGEDPDSFVRKQGKARFLAQVEGSESLTDFFFRHLSENVSLKEIEGRAIFVQNALQHLREMKNGILRDLLLQELSRQSGLAIDQLQQQLTQPKYSASKKSNAEPNYSPNIPPTENNDPNVFLLHSKPPENKYNSKYSGAKKTWNGPFKPRAGWTPQPTRTTAPPSLFNILIRHLLKQPERVQELQLPKGWTHFPSLPPEAKILAELIDQLQLDPKISIAFLMGLWHGQPEGQLLSQLTANEFLLNADSIELEFTDVTQQLQRWFLEQELELELSRPERNMKKILHLLQQKADESI